MKKLFTLLFFASVLATSVHASIPVKKERIEATSTDAKTTVIATDKGNIDFNASFSESVEEAVSPAVTSGMDNDFLITVLLWFFIGYLAAHRWYKKKDPLMNILFIITLGGFGIWWLIDGINILTKKF